MEDERTFILIIVVPAILVFIALLNFIGNGGPFGVNPVASGCMGWKVGLETIKKYFPYGDKEYKTPVHVRYLVREDTKEELFCLGQNIK